MQAQHSPPQFHAQDLVEHVVPYYQPIYSLMKNTVVRYECLARLLDAQQNIYMPNEFLYIVEYHEDTANMTSRILEMSRAYCGPRQISWSVNLFDNDLSDKKLLNTITHMCKESSNKLCGIELHFDSIKHDLVSVANMCKDNPNMHVTVDDIQARDINKFATELYALVASGVHAIKVKAEVFNHCELDESAEHEKGSHSQSYSQVIRALQAHCNAHQCGLIAEHIEDERTLNAVKAAGIEFGQGYFLSQPSSKVVPIHSA
ncbi:EAL domain-containing protein [Ningiella sp. W23]|uniref:EAL domain-containing protein n=1 Tax=Ningiella sp. W23 TaxID=3023715 RepID=UPI0037571960